MMQEERYPGACTCGTVQYVMHRRPMFVHCCHCRWCQRETGAAFALNGLIEADAVSLTSGTVEMVNTPTRSGLGQSIARCPTCKVALWSNYGAAKDAVKFVRIGTLADPDAFPPDIHIFTSSKQPWVKLEGGAPAVAEYYARSEHWPAESIARYNKALGH
jgi:hypothetical protein